MATRNIVKVFDNEEILRKKSKPVKEFDENLWVLLDDMKETMHQNEGMGLAAVQVGILKRILIVEANNLFLELINPEIISQKGSDIEKEGCLSVGPEYDYVKRPMTVTVKAKDRMGYEFTITGEKYLARVLCHEIDHLDGILYTDKVLLNYKADKDEDSISGKF
ncbi:MAG: peptide deformylase [Clostridia bacterium]|nr:peptide deformylase [Clostridia bacterium]